MTTLTKENKELVSFLQQYIRTDTTQPNPDYQKVCDLFKTYAQRDGFDCSIIILPSGKPVIIITHSGTNIALPSLLLNHHMDVVPALNTEQWIAPPFEGAVLNDMIIGRGSQDIKGLGAVHYFALKAIKDAGIKLEQTVHLTVVPDEEIGGFTGTQQFMGTDFFKKMNVKYVLDEGIPSGNEKKLLIKVSERKPLQIKITTTGSLAHGSKLNCFNAIHELISILHAFTILHNNQQEKSSSTADGLLLSTNITSLTAGVHNDNTTTLNIVPETASATLDIRIPQTIAVNDIIKIIDDILKLHPNSTYTILAMVPDYNIDPVYQTSLYNSLEKSIRHFGLEPEPLFFEATTDLRYYKKIGIDGVGFTPFTTQDNIHGTNESVPIQDIILAQNIMINFLKIFCIGKNND